MFCILNAGNPGFAFFTELFRAFNVPRSLSARGLKAAEHEFFLVRKFWPRVGLFLMAIALIAVTKRTSFQPWYFLYLLPFVALLPDKKWLFWLTTSLSAGFLLHYAPFLYLGNWNPPVPEIKIKLNLIFVILGLLLAGLSRLKKINFPARKILRR